MNLSDIKLKIRTLMEKEFYQEVIVLLKDSINRISYDQEIYTMYMVALVQLNYVEEALKFGLSALKSDLCNADINYNIGYIYMLNNDINRALTYYKTAVKFCDDLDTRIIMENEISRLESELECDCLKKIVLLVKEGMDSFLPILEEELSERYVITKVIVNNSEQIDEAMKWADIVWFEWCDELVVYGSNQLIAKNKKIICRLHSYEAFMDYPKKVNWNNVDKVICISKTISDILIEDFKVEKSKVEIIHNGIDLNKYKYRKRASGYNIAYVGYINYKKGPMILLHSFKAIFDRDNRFKLFIAGQFQDKRDSLYFQQMIKEFDMEGSIVFTGWQNDLDSWMEDKNYILCTSILESQNISVMQAMVKGIKPVIHNFVGARNIYKSDYLWNTINEAVEMVVDKKYESEEYRRYIEDNFSIEKQIEKVINVINE